MRKLCPRCLAHLPARSFNVNRSKKDGLQRFCKPCQAAYDRDLKEKNKARYEAATTVTKKFHRELASKRYLITSAQNATPVHAQFFQALQVAAKHLKAELVVIPYRYKNPTSILEARHQDHDQWWADEVQPFLFNGRKKLGPNLVLAADVKMQPTASQPLSGFEALTGAESCILGHPKMQFRTVAVPTGRFPKILTTTGTCTRSRGYYSQTKAGAIGEFHHYLGAVIVELDGKRFHLRQINANRTDGSFTDLDKHYTAEGVEDAQPALGLVMGDTHVRVTDQAVDRATFGKGGIVETLQPRSLVWHDVFDGETCNPHEVGNPFVAEAKRKANRLDVRAEIQEMIDFVRARSEGRQSVIVDSNHHAFLTRWVIRTDWKFDLKNAAFYLETAQAMLASASMGEGGAMYDDPFPYWVKKLGGDGANIRCLNPDESFKIAGIECGMHGNHGPNGSRGSLKNLSRLGSKSIIGHTHTPGIEEGGYNVGTSTPRRLAYQRGPGSHLNTHCVIYATGARALITIVDGSWRA
jgi:hypothetical protein